MPASDESPPGRPVFFPVVIAAVFLSIIGASAGLVFGSRADERRQAAARQPLPVVVTTATTGPAAPARPAATAARPTPTTAARPPVPAQACRPETERQAARAGSVGVVRRALRIRTSSSVVWICVDGEGRHFYHGNRGGPDDPWVEGETALFLTDVEPVGGGYRARATGAQGTVTTYLVSRQELVITHPDGRIERQPAVDD